MSVQVIVIVKDIAVGIGSHIPSGTACLLNIILQRIRNFIMHDKADIALVHTHTEGGGCDNNPYSVIDEIILSLDLFANIHLTMECPRFQPVPIQAAGNLLCSIRHCNIDNCGRFAVEKKIPQCRILFIFTAMQNSVMKIRPGRVCRI